MNVRLYERDGLVYAFRDVFNMNGRLVTCQYATVGTDRLRWSDCREGADFSEVEPLGHAIKREVKTYL